jgi:hypothetical protein
MPPNADAHWPLATIRRRYPPRKMPTTAEDRLPQWWGRDLNSDVCGEGSGGRCSRWDADCDHHMCCILIFHRCDGIRAQSTSRRYKQPRIRAHSCPHIGRVQQCGARQLRTIRRRIPALQNWLRLAANKTDIRPAAGPSRLNNVEPDSCAVVGHVRCRVRARIDLRSERYCAAWMHVP